MTSHSQIEQELGLNFLRKLGNNDAASEAEYVKNIRRIQKSNPAIFEQIQSKNTDANSKVLDTLAFDMDNQSQDPISRKGVEDLEFRTHVPLGMSELSPTNNYGYKRAQTDTETGKSYIYQAALDNEQRLPSTLRHEGTHGAFPELSESYVRRLDAAYGDVNNNSKSAKAARTFLKQEGYPDDLSWKNFRQLMTVAAKKGQFTDTSRDEPNSTKGKEKFNFNDLNFGKEGSQGMLDILENADKFPRMSVNTAPNGTYSRDLPNIGWFDKLINNLR